MTMIEDGEIITWLRSEESDESEEEREYKKRKVDEKRKEQNTTPFFSRIQPAPRGSADEP